MPLGRKPTAHKFTQYRQSDINNSDEDDQRTLMHRTNEDAVKDENKVKRRPDGPITCTRIMEIANSVHKKPATPDYTRVSHHRTCQQSACRFLRFTNNEPPKGPFFISFKKRPAIIATNYYDERCRMSFFEQAFSNPRCIGKGSFGEVFKAFSRDDKRCYAIKITVEPFHSPADREDKLREVKKHELLPKHPNLISYIRAWEEYGFLYIQTELCQCSLLDYKMKVGTIPEKDLWLFFGDIASAVRYLHSNELLHLDIKPQNVMVSFDGICKLGDFSLIIDIQKDSKEEEGDGKYLAPEVLQKGAHKPSDIFSLGMTMIDVCTDLELPSTGDLWQGFRCKKIYYGFVKGNVPPALLDVLLLLLETDPSKRPTAEEICCIPILAKCIRERRTSDESPMFKNGIIPRVTDASRLDLRFEEDDEDYKYDDIETESCDEMAMSQNENEPISEVETSVNGEPHFGKIEENARTSLNEELHSDEVKENARTCANEEPHFNEIDEKSGMDVDASSSNSVENFNERDDPVGNTNGLSNLFRDEVTFYRVGPKDSLFRRNDGSNLRREYIPCEMISNVEDEFERQLSVIRQIIAASDDDYELPGTSGSTSDRPKSPHRSSSSERSPLRSGYTTPPSNTTPSPFVCKTPARGRSDDLAEQRVRHYYWWQESLKSPTRRTHKEAIDAAASRNGTSPEVPHQLSGLEEGLVPSVGDPTRRRAYFHMRELSPPAKRAQTGGEEGTGDNEDHIDDPQIKKSDTAAK
ncbi:unnamed protein product [Litomosoides sigmodontis]|uniref:non-specific serine/threonine protein kinase n=1 Tax=Litomosoides sigmodontis TaxID=42156 RepID=A0A3P6U203_LITSI|nr:unnamed protein product [Litomosoides sigmodontis]